MKKDPAFLFKKLVADASPPSPGPTVYAVFVRNQIYHAGTSHLLYIGCSMNAERRRRSARHPYMFCFHRFPDHLVYFKCFDSDNRFEDESILINHYKPLLNKQYKNG